VGRKHEKYERLTDGGNLWAMSCHDARTVAPNYNVVEL
jgi:hypothetical protein